jgi:hypothetical protein
MPLLSSPLSFPRPPLLPARLPQPLASLPDLGRGAAPNPHLAEPGAPSLSLPLPPFCASLSLPTASLPDLGRGGYSEMPHLGEAPCLFSSPSPFSFPSPLASPHQPPRPRSRTLGGGGYSESTPTAKLRASLLPLPFSLPTLPPPQPHRLCSPTLGVEALRNPHLARSPHASSLPSPPFLLPIPPHPCLSASPAPSPRLPGPCGVEALPKSTPRRSPMPLLLLPFFPSPSPPPRSLRPFVEAVRIPSPHAPLAPGPCVRGALPPPRLHDLEAKPDATPQAPPHPLVSPSLPSLLALAPLASLPDLGRGGYSEVHT